MLTVKGRVQMAHNAGKSNLKTLPPQSSQPQLALPSLGLIFRNCRSPFFSCSPEAASSIFYYSLRRGTGVIVQKPSSDYGRMNLQTS